MTIIWDRYRGFVHVYPSPADWYTHLTTYGELTAEMPKGDRIQKRHDFRDDLVDLCAKAGILYRSPHKFRHGHAVYALKKARTVPQLKAISQNLMHSNMGVTDGIYGRLVDEDVRDYIASLGE